VLSFVSASTSMLFWVIFLLPFSGHGRTMTVLLFCTKSQYLFTIIKILFLKRIRL
jgi:hypothetical protein